MKNTGDLRGLLANSNVLGAVATAAMLWLLFLPGANGLDPLGYHWGHDFVNYWSGGHLAVTGRTGVLYDLEAYFGTVKSLVSPDVGFVNFSYPPSVLPLLAPLGFLPYGAAFAVWTIGGLAALAWTVTVGTGRRDARTIALLLLSPIAVFCLAFGQASTLFATMLVGGLTIRSRRPILAGVLFGLATIKPQLGAILPFYLLWVRDWRAIGAAALTAALLIGLSLMFWGTAPWREYIAVTMPYQADVVANPGRYGSIAQLEFSPFVTLRMLGLSTTVAGGIHALLAVVGGLAALAAARRARSTSFTVAALAFATVMIQPYSLAYDLIIPATALVILADADTGRSSPAWATLPLRLFWLEPPIVMLVWTAAPSLLLGVWCVLPAFAVLMLDRLKNTIPAATPPSRT